MASKRLVMMRHAKSDWDADAKSDHERPLNHRGRREAPQVAQTLRKEGLSPDLVISSDATRTRETWERMEDELDGARVVFDASLYLAGIDAVRASLERHGPAVADARVVMMLGHNPGWEETVHALTGQNVELKTAHAAVLAPRHKHHGLLECLGEDHGFELVTVIRPHD
jgi:phosphohistidine phosphatase